MIASQEINFITRSRRTIIFGTLVFILTCGLPLFLYTTLIHRAQLPMDEVATNTASFHEAIRFDIPIHVVIDPSYTHILDVWQKEIDAENSKQGLGKNWALLLKQQEEASPLMEGYSLTVVFTENAENSYKISPTSREIQITVGSDESSHLFISDVLLNRVFGDERKAMKSILAGSKSSDTSETVFPYSNTYNVVYNLFVEDGRPVTWDIDAAIEAVNPIFDAFKDYAKFKISTQIQYYSKLRSTPQFDENARANILKQDELPTFINFGDWNLNTHDINPTINFILYFAESNYDQIPLIVEGSRTNSFLIPQWGGVHIFNTNMPILKDSNFKFNASKLEQVFEIFTSQLFELIGVPKKPESPWIRIDSLNRITTLKNLKRCLENLSSLVKLSTSLNEISIPESTKLHFEKALKFYNLSIDSLKQSRFQLAKNYASQSVESSDKAFFEKEMVQQAYFPSEHRLAVFLPLLGPICSIVLIGVIKALKSRDTNEVIQQAQRKKDE